jgi:signal transduction histidine kinase
LNNLFSNATRHNNAAGIISIICKQGLLTISNSGSNIALDKDRIFRRFYKASSNGEHNGLGLSIIYEICDASGVRIDYSFDNDLHQFTLTWNTPQVELENIPYTQTSNSPASFAIA